MKKCDYCRKKIGLFSVMYTWLDKENEIAVHDKCLKEWDNKFPEKLKELEKYSKIDYKTLSEDDRKKIFDNFVKDVQRDTLYLVRGRVKKFHKDEEIRWLENYIEEIKKDENHIDKEKKLMQLNEWLKQLKNEDKD